MSKIIRLTPHDAIKKLQRELKSSGVYEPTERLRLDGHIHQVKCEKTGNIAIYIGQDQQVWVRLFHKAASKQSKFEKNNALA